MNAGMPRAADPPLRSQMPDQLLFQRSARLNEQGAIINHFVRHMQALDLEGKEEMGLSEITGMDTQLKHDDLLALDRTDFNMVGVIRERSSSSFIVPSVCAGIRRKSRLGVSQSPRF